MQGSVRYQEYDMSLPPSSVEFLEERVESYHFEGRASREVVTGKRGLFLKGQEVK